MECKPNFDAVAALAVSCASSVAGDESSAARPVGAFLPMAASTSARLTAFDSLSRYRSSPLLYCCTRSTCPLLSADTWMAVVPIVLMPTFTPLATNARAQMVVTMTLTGYPSSAIVIVGPAPGLVGVGSPGVDGNSLVE